MATPGRTYKYEAIRISDLATVQDVIQDCTFEDCLLIGPAVLLLSGNLTLRECHFDAKDWERLFLPWTPSQDPSTAWPIGFIPAVSCTFVRCEFRRITFSGSLALKSELIGGTTER